MTALIFAPPAWHFYAFPLLIRWRGGYDALAFYFPHLQFGLLEDQPNNKNFTSLLQPPRQKDVSALKSGYYPGELRQWQAYLDYVAAQDDQDETDLTAIIRGRLEPVLPKEADRDLLWNLAYQLERMLMEKAAGLERLAGQQQALAKTLGDELSEASDLEMLQATLAPSLFDSQPDPVLARVRYQFWRQVLAPHLQNSWATLVLEAFAGASSPRHLWETMADEDHVHWQAGFDLPDWRRQPEQDPLDLHYLQLGVEFQKVLGELLQALTDNPGEVELSRQKMLRLAEERLWPLSGLPQAQAIHLEVCGWLRGASQSALFPEPMIFLSPAG